MTKIRSGIVSSLLSMVAFPIFVSPVQATLIGDTITATGNSLQPASATIDAITQSPVFSGFGAIQGLDFDFDAHTLSIK